MKQIRFGFFKNISKSFGGEHLIGKRKSKRPISTKNPLHLVLRATSADVFKPTNLRLEKLIYRTAKESGVKIYELAVNWSHIHFVIKLEERKSYIKFVRVLTSRLAIAVASVGHGQGASSRAALSNKLFALRPFTRILEWGKDFKNAISYLKLNHKEARGEIKREKKKSPNRTKSVS